VFRALGGDARSLARAACVCRAWRDEASADALWRPLFAATFAARRGTRRAAHAHAHAALADAAAALPRGATCWRDAFAAAARACPRAVAERTARARCTRCGALTWLPSAQPTPAAEGEQVVIASSSAAAPARVRRAHLLVPVSPARAARATLRAHALLPHHAGSSSSSSSSSDGGEQRSSGGEDSDDGACFALHCCCAALLASPDHMCAPQAAQTRRTGCGRCRAAWRSCA
jgi:hypothetical protein